MPHRHDQARLQSVVDTAVDGVILIDASGSILMFNPACESLFGYHADDVIDKNVKILMPSPYHEEHDLYLSNYHRTGERKIIGIGREVIGRRKDGTTFPMDLSVGEVKEEGNKSVFVGIIRDLTARKQAEMTIREGAARLRMVADTAVDGLILIDEPGSVLMFNKACERLFGYDADEVIGQNVKLLMPEPYHAEHDRYLQNYRRTRERKVIGIGREVVGRRKDGTTFPMDLSVGEGEEGGRPIFVGIIHDISERKRNAGLLVQAQKMEAIGQLTGGMAHDFNNLLTVILGTSEILVDKLGSNQQLRAVAEMTRTAAERGSDLTNCMLAFARRQALEPKIVDVNKLLSSMDVLLRGTLGEHIDIAIVVPGGLWPALIDPAQLESAILNLCLNARDAMGDGGHLTIETANVRLDAADAAVHGETHPGHYVMIAVTDTGAGMTPDVIARAFDPFFTTKDVGKGSGLGLSMIYGFLKQSGGHVKIYSEVGHGTTVKCYLPRVYGVEDELEKEEETDIAKSGGDEFILLVEDDNLVRAYVETQLLDLGYQVKSVRNGNEALETARNLPSFDLLFTDIVMPGGMSGYDLADKILKLRPGTRILLTSGYTETALIHAQRLGPKHNLLNKPYHKQELASKIRSVLDSN